MHQWPSVILVSCLRRGADCDPELTKCTSRYSQGCFIGCPTCDNASGRRQTDLCGLGKKQTLTDPKYWSVNRDAVPFSDTDICTLILPAPILHHHSFSVPQTSTTRGVHQAALPYRTRAAWLVARIREVTELKLAITLRPSTLNTVTLGHKFLSHCRITPRPPTRLAVLPKLCGVSATTTAEVRISHVVAAAFRSNNH